VRRRPGIRVAAAGVFFTLVLGVILFRLGWVQLGRHAYYGALADAQQRGQDLLPTSRGVIYDRNLNPLAVSRSGFDIYCLPRLVKDPRSSARALAPLLGRDAAAVAADLNARDRSVWLARELPRAAATKVMALGLTGVFARPSERRFYPEGTLACHVLGYAGARDGSRAGVERTMDVYLAGLPGLRAGREDAAGRALPDLTENFVPPLAGFSCVLTLDKWCQYVAERELAATCERYGAPAGAVVVMRPATGEVLALASYPAYDPNRYGDYPPECWRNNALATPIEPGSIIKPFVVAGALEEGAVTLGDTFDCSRPLAFGPYEIKDVKPVADPLTVAGVIEHSSNIGVVRIGQRLGGRRTYDYLTRFGFGERTGIALNAENVGVLRARTFTRPLGHAFACFGQGIAATPLQLAAAACALANGGFLVKPMLVSAIKDENGRVVRSYRPEVVRRAVSAATAARVLAMMELVVEEGGGKEARVAGYRVAVKTGTSEIAGEGGAGYVTGAFNASFLGIAPLPDPEVVIFVTICRPRADFFGGKVAAPTFARIAADILPALKVPPEGAPHVVTAAAPLAPSGELALSDCPAAAAVSRLSWLGLRMRLTGRGGRVLWTSADRGAVPAAGSVVEVTVGGAGDVMPLVVGLSVREAMRSLGPLGCRVTLAGDGGWVVAQYPAAGARPSAACRLTLGSRRRRAVPVPAAPPTDPATGARVEVAG